MRGGVFFLARVLHPDNGLLREYVAFHPNGWIARLKYVWYWLGVASPLALAATAFFGYYYTAQEFALRLGYTTLLMVLLVVVRALLLRWLLVHRRHLSIRQARSGVPQPWRPPAHRAAKQRRCPGR